MEGQSSQNELQLMSLDFGWNDYDVSQLAEIHPYQHYFLADGSDGFHYVSPPLPQWIQCQQNTPKYVEFLAENGVSELQGDISHRDISGMTSSFQHAVSFLDMDAQQAIHPRLHNESSINNFTSAEHEICVQALQTQNSNGGHSNAFQPHSSVFPPKPRRRVSRKRASASDRLRRVRIAERLNALQELLPQSKERRLSTCQKKRKEKDTAMYNWLCLSQTLANAEQGDKATVLDDIIDHIKYLQAQIKGYGHYLHYEQMLKQPLEEMMGKLMEMNPLAAGQLLQSRGLFMMPMAMAIGEGLHHTT